MSNDGDWRPGEEREVQQLILRDDDRGCTARSTDYYVCDIAALGAVLPRVVERPLSSRPISRHRSGVDPFRAQEIERYRRQSPGDRLLEALGVMEDGIAMKRANLVRRHPELDDAGIDAKLQAWLDRVE